MPLDVIIIADSDTDSVSESSPMRLTLDGWPATVQAAQNFISNQGRIVPPVKDDTLSWASAPKLNGIALLSFLQSNGIQTALVNDYAREQERFQLLVAQKPKAILISTTFIISKQALNQLVTSVRQYACNIPIVIGGPFVVQSYRMLQRRDEPEYSRPELEQDFLFWETDEPDVDLCVTTLRGQNNLLKALQNIEVGKPLTDIANTAWRSDNGQWQFGPDVPPPSDQLEDHIDWDSLPDEVFASKVIPLQASSGCPYRCAFCNFVKDPHVTYAKTPEQIVGEMLAVARRGVRYVWFVDDVFRLGNKDLSLVAKAMIDAKLNLKWMTFIRADTVKDVDFGLLKQAGCTELQFGLESADPDVLGAMNKKADPDVYRQSIKSAMTAGIDVSAYFIFGHPGETETSIERTIRFMQSVQYPDLPGSLSWSIYPFLLVPLSPIYDQPLRTKYNLEGYMMDWAHQTMDYKGAVMAIKQAILSLNQSAPIYRTDNLEVLDQLPQDARKAFFRSRLSLAKLNLAGQLTTETTFQTFAKILKLKP